MNPSASNRPPAPLSERWPTSPSSIEGPRLFSRMGLDLPIQDAIPLALEAASRIAGLLIYCANAPRHSAEAASTATANESSNIVVPVYVDEPLDPRGMEGAKEIEFQFLPSPRMRTGGGAYRGDWVPTLPSDGTHINDLRDRVTLARQMSGREDVQVGAAIAAANVVADLPWLADCGFDYACILVDAQYGLTPQAQVQLADTETAIGCALETVRSRNLPSFGLRLSSAFVTPAKGALWHAMGFEAIGIDSWLRARVPSPEPKFQASFGGILIESARASGSADWLLEGVQQFQKALASERRYLGW